jgi:hypothetical protein
MKCTHSLRNIFIGGRVVLLLVLTPMGQLAAQPCVQPPVGLVSWWPGDGNADDITGSNDGTLKNGATFARGMVGQAFSIDGIDDFVKVPHHASQNLQNALTIDGWVMIKGPCEWLNCIVVMKQQGVTGPCCDHLRYGLLVLDDPLYGSDNGKAVLSLNTGVWEDVVFSTTILEHDRWYHLAGTYDGSVAQLYVNGVLENTVPKTGPVLASTAGPLFIGRDQGEDGFGGGEFFNGLIDEVEIYNRALTAEEIQAIYDVGSAGKCKPAVGGTVSGLSPTKVTCANKTTGGKVAIRDGAKSYDCKAAGLAVHPGDSLSITVQGTAD